MRNIAICICLLALSAIAYWLLRPLAGFSEHFVGVGIAPRFTAHYLELGYLPIPRDFWAAWHWDGQGDYWIIFHAKPDSAMIFDSEQDGISITIWNF